MKLFTCTVLATTAVLFLAAPASAETRTVHDPAGDHRTSGFDLRKVTYHNTDRAVLARVEVADLRRNAVVHVEISPREAVNGYGAEVRKRDGKVRVSLVETDSGDRVPCNLTATWRPVKDIVSVRVPAHCLAHVDTQVVRAKTWLSKAGHPVSDSSRARIVQRG